MAGRIAELLVREQHLSGARAKEACRKECSELIRQLDAICQELDPNSTRNSINRSLRVLAAAGDHSYWFRQPRETPKLEQRCDLTAMDAETLLKRLISIHDAQHDALLFLGIDDFFDSGALDQIEGVNADLVLKLGNLRSEILDELDAANGWQKQLRAATDRGERLGLLCDRIRALARESQRVVKEIEQRG